MAKIVGIAGSLRKGSYNAALLRAAAALVPPGTTFIVESIAEIPIFNADLEEEHFPEPVLRLQQLIAGADALLMVTPEYNNGVPGVFKNAIDWLSRGDLGDTVFPGLTVAIMGASPGRAGTALSQAAWLPTLRTLETHLWTEGRLQVGGAASVFDPSGAILDPTVNRLLAGYMERFIAYVEAHPR